MLAGSAAQHNPTKLRKISGFYAEIFHTKNLQLKFEIIDLSKMVSYNNMIDMNIKILDHKKWEVWEDLDGKLLLETIPTTP